MALIHGNDNQHVRNYRRKLLFFFWRLFALPTKYTSSALAKRSVYYISINLYTGIERKTKAKNQLNPNNIRFSPHANASKDCLSNIHLESLYAHRNRTK